MNVSDVLQAFIPFFLSFSQELAYGTGKIRFKKKKRRLELSIVPFSAIHPKHIFHLSIQVT